MPLSEIKGMSAFIATFNFSAMYFHYILLTFSLCCSPVFLPFFVLFFGFLFPLISFVNLMGGAAALELRRGTGGQVLRPNYTCSSFVLSWLELLLVVEEEEEGSSRSVYSSGR